MGSHEDDREKAVGSINDETKEDQRGPEGGKQAGDPAT